MKTLKVMGIIGIIWFSIGIIYAAALLIKVHASELLYGLALSIVCVVQANQVKKNKLKAI